MEVKENASVWYKREDVIKFTGDPKQWRQGRFWSMVETERILDWAKLNDTLSSNL